MKYNANRAYAPICKLAIMTIMINNDNNRQLLALFTIIVNYWNYWLLFAWNFIMFIIRLIFIIVASSYYCQLFRLLRLFVIIVFIVLKRIIVYIEIIGIYVLACACCGWSKQWMVWMADIRCTLTDLGGQNCDGEEFQPKHPGVVSEKVTRCSLGLHTSCQWMPVDGGDSQLRVFTNSPSQMMHLKPNACTTAGPAARFGMIGWFLAGCAVKVPAKMISESS